MKTYENSYFRLRLDLPDTWALTSWRHTEINRDWRPMYQQTDDDLPNNEDESKFLFTARRHAPESEALVDADIEFSVFRLSPNEEMRTGILQNFERMRPYYERHGAVESILNEGVWTIGGADFGFIDQTSKGRFSQSWYRFVFWRIDETLWLYGKIAGHKVEAYFEEALGIMQGLKSIDSRGYA